MNRRRSLVLALMLACSSSAAAPRVPGKGTAADKPVAEWIYDSGLKPGWKDYGWAPRTLETGKPLRLDVAAMGGWIAAKPGLSGRFGGVTFRFHAPPELGDFFEVRVDSAQPQSFPRVKVGPEHRVDLPDGWCEVWIEAQELNPRGLEFDRVVLRSHRRFPSQTVEIDKLGLLKSAFGSSTLPDTPALSPQPVRTLVVDCRQAGHRISPLVYGIAYDPRLDSRDDHQWKLGATARRWGGNPASRYNWELGNAWNSANDWFFRNLNYASKDDFTWDDFLKDNIARKMKTALTIPLLGWVAKDTTSYSFSVKQLGPQQYTDPELKDRGNGNSPDGRPLAPGPPTQTSVPFPPEKAGRWVAAIRKLDKARGLRSVQQYILDNEPMLWNSTHRDVHPEPTSYDELLDRTIAYATQVRRADPEAVIAGPALWGWPAYFFSAVDAKVSFRLRPDRLAHGNVPLLPWYLRKLREHEEKTGLRLLDVVDVHYYPQGEGMKVGKGGAVDPATAARRIRSTRGLWDPSYVDESWIKESVQLIPRLKEWIRENYPGLKISIGEYNWGAEDHMSGALALAESLGRFGEQDVYSAFYWTYPAKNSPAFGAFRAFRNFDGQGGHFLDFFVPTTGAAPLSLFASRDETREQMVAIVLNFDASQEAPTRLDFSRCGTVLERRLFQLSQSAPVLEAKGTKAVKAAVLEETLPPYSITVFDLRLEKPTAPAK